MNSLFDAMTATKAPLAERMRPKNFDEFYGQSHIVGNGKLLKRAISSGKLGSCIFWGPPGCGKTTLASIIANSINANFVKLNAVSSGVSDAKAVMEKAKVELELWGKRTYLLLDECHRWSKAQSDCVLEGIEKGIIMFIGSTTENPYASMTKAIVSRCMVFEFQSLSVEDIEKAIDRALTDKENGYGAMKVVLDKDARTHIIRMSGGDVRKALNALEIAVMSTPFTEKKTPKNGTSEREIIITKQIAEDSMQSKTLSLDDDTYYDMLSAFCKSLRGSDATASVYWSRRLIDSGIDPMVIARRLIAHASEDVGIADSNALVVAVSAMTAFEKMGRPEGEIPLTHAIIYVANAPKSNSVVIAMSKAKEDVQTTFEDAVPKHLRNTNWTNEPREAYKYPHNYPGHKVDQQYLPNEIKDHNYFE